MGGSTITQQLARNIFLGYEKTYSRKIKEMFIAVALEQKYTKQEILEFYLNNVYFANGYYGIESASEAYFNKNAKDLSISQIAFLCSIPNSPNRYDPYKHKDSTLKRRDRILKNMYEDGYISESQIFDLVESENVPLFDIEYIMDQLDGLNFKIAYLGAHIDEEPEVTITFFVKDKRKSGGAYITVTGSIDEIDEYERTIILSNRTIIPVADIIQITGNCFDDMELF